MDLVIGNKVITTPLIEILTQLQFELNRYNGKIKDIKNQDSKNIAVTCPCNEHKGGFESRPSCQIFADPNDEEIEFGTVHCFSCGYRATLPQFIGYCFDENEDFGKEWLLLRCDTCFASEVKFLPEIILDKPKKEITYLNESELSKYAYYHNYMWERKLTKEVVDKFEVGFDPKQNTLTFPVRDDKGNLRFITRRSIVGKRFYIPKDVEKPLYLLYYIKQHNIDKVIITEAQIDALTAWSYGAPAIASIGGISDEQIKSLNKSGIRIVISMFDNDFAGNKFYLQLKSKLRDDILLLKAKFPLGVKDINDMTKEQFYQALQLFE